jgi:hypothetical protein
LALLSACKPKAGGGGASGANEQVEVKVLVKVDYPGFKQALAKDQTVKFRDTGSTIGQITSVTDTPTLVGVATWNGNLVMTKSPNLHDINITIVGTGKNTDSGYTFGGTHLYVNQTAKMIAPYAQFDPLVLSIKRIGS